MQQVSEDKFYLRDKTKYVEIKESDWNTIKSKIQEEKLLSFFFGMITGWIIGGITIYIAWRLTK